MTPHVIVERTARMPTTFGLQLPNFKFPGIEDGQMFELVRQVGSRIVSEFG